MWLARKLEKPILKLTEEDYPENGLGECSAVTAAPTTSTSSFPRLMRTITGWPGGKDGRKRVLVFSPHPDDDVICMAGTMIRLVEQGHDVHIAYMSAEHRRLRPQRQPLCRFRQGVQQDLRPRRRAVGDGRGAHRPVPQQEARATWTARRSRRSRG